MALDIGYNREKTFFVKVQKENLVVNKEFGVCTFHIDVVQPVVRQVVLVKGTALQ